VSEAGELDDRVAALEAEHAAFDIRRQRLLDERVAFVVKRRKSLVRDGDKATAEKLDQYLALVDALEQAREELIALRQTTLWAALFPSETLGTDPPFSPSVSQTQRPDALPHRSRPFTRQRREDENRVARD
jgi:hypothetical protein